MPYFTVSSGLRGCYMDDSGATYRVTTRRELKSIVESECNNSREAYGHGGPKAEIAFVVALIWRETRKGAKRSHYPYAIGFGRSRDAKDRPFGVFVSHSDRSEWKAQSED